MPRKETTGVKPDQKSHPKYVTPASKRTEQQLRVKFTEPEILALARQLAEANMELAQAEDEKKAVTAQLKAKCDGIVAKVGEYSGKINAGYEYRTVKVETSYDDPKLGLKTTRRLDTLEIVENGPMTVAELQGELPGIPADAPASSKMIAIGTAKVSRPALRSASASGVVATEGDGQGAELNDEDTGKS